MTESASNHRLQFPDGNVRTLSQLDGGIPELFNSVINRVQLATKNSNQGPIAEICWRLRLAAFSYGMLRSLHAMQLAPYFQFKNSETPNSSPTILLSTIDPAANIVAGDSILAMQTFIESLYLQLARVIQIFRDENALSPHKKKINDAGKGCMNALNQLMKHSEAQWNEAGIYSVPHDLTAGISLKPHHTEPNALQDEGTICNSRDLLTALDSVPFT